MLDELFPRSRDTVDDSKVADLVDVLEEPFFEALYLVALNLDVMLDGVVGRVKAQRTRTIFSVLCQS